MEEHALFAREFFASAPTKQETLREQTLKEITNRATKYNEKVALKAGSGVDPGGPWARRCVKCQVTLCETNDMPLDFEVPRVPHFQTVQEDSWNHGSLLGRHSE